jgi:hypothetical protein
MRQLFVPLLFCSLAACAGSSAPTPLPEELSVAVNADLNHDGVVNINDLNLAKATVLTVQANLGKTVPIVNPCGVPPG